MTTPVDAPLPPRRGGPLARVLKSRRLAWCLARVGAALGRWWGRPLRLGKIVIVIRHRDVSDALARDLDFTIAPVNGPRFAEIGFPFILGMDRTERLVSERGVLYRALAAVDMAALRTSTAKDIAERTIGLSQPGFDAIGGLARPVAARTAQRLLGLSADLADIMADARALFEHCFLNQSNDPAVARTAMVAAERTSHRLLADIAARRAADEPGDDLMGQLIRLGADDDLARRTLGGMLVGAVDTTATIFAKSLWILASQPEWLAAARSDVDDPVRLYGWSCEALRRWTHVPILGRAIAGETRLGGTLAPAGGRLLLWSQAAMVDPAAFPDPLAMVPDRPRPGYLHLGGGLHPCAGRGVTAMQLPLLTGAMLRAGFCKVERITWDGPFPDRMTFALAEAGQ